MSANHRICETCVYCSFAGNCDRYDKPLTSIEQPACDSYEIHPLLAENAKLVSVLHEVEEDAIYAYHCLQSDIEHVVEGQTHFFEKWWHAECERDRLEAENAKLRELVRGLHMAYVGALNECEGMDAGLIWDHCEMVDAELAKSHARFEVDRHRFDVALSELGVEVSK